jgi:transcriptional regulator with XRE-family HTH domain
VAKRRPVFYEGTLGRYFRDLREEKGWSLIETVSLAKRKRLPVGLGALKWLEGGLTKNPEQTLLRSLSTLYGEPYANIVREVTRRVYAITPHELLEGTPPPTAVEGFIALPVLAKPIAAGQPLLVTPDPDHDTHLAFSREFVKRFTRPVGLRVGRKEVAMTPTIEPGDVVLIDQNVARRRRPRDGRVYAINFEPLTGQDGGGLQRITLSGHTLILNSDNPDKAAYPPRAFALKGTNLLEVLLGEVVWSSRVLASRNAK